MLLRSLASKFELGFKLPVVADAPVPAAGCPVMCHVPAHVDAEILTLPLGSCVAHDMAGNPHSLYSILRNPCHGSHPDVLHLDHHGSRLCCSIDRVFGTVHVRRLLPAMHLGSPPWCCPCSHCCCRHRYRCHCHTSAPCPPSRLK
jgi:hypothetical protein